MYKRQDIGDGWFFSSKLGALNVAGMTKFGDSGSEPGILTSYRPTISFMELYFGQMKDDWGFWAGAFPLKYNPSLDLHFYSNKLVDIPFALLSNSSTLGFSGYNIEEGGILSTTAGKASISYLLTLDLKHNVRFGLSFGGGSQILDFGELDDPFDPAYANIADNSTFALADFGLTYHAGHFNFGFSIPNLISYDKFADNDSSNPIRVKPLDNIMLQTFFRGHLSDNLSLIHI